MPTRSVLVTGATGYLGRPLTALLLARGHSVRAFVRGGSQNRASPRVPLVIGNPFSVDDVAAALTPDDTLVHLIGPPRPSPRRTREFIDVDLASIRTACIAAKQVGIAHLVYVSVAQPAPIMQAYIDVRTQGEELVRATGVPATIIRPWYVLGPGHRWPYLLLPFYWVYERIPSKRETALRLGLVTQPQMIMTLLNAVERGPTGQTVIEVPQIRAISAV